MIRVELLKAWPRRHESVEVLLEDGATVAAAMAASGWTLDAEFVSLAVFGMTAGADTRLHDGDRVELLRRLELDPKQARRLRANRARKRSQEP